MITIDASVWISGLEKRDSFHPATSEFFHWLGKRPLHLNTPSYALVEVACALMRRTGDRSLALKAVQKLREWPLLEIVPGSLYLPEPSLLKGLEHSLRSGDAIYAATASMTGTALITWDAELIERAGGVTPTDWLARQN